ncbi:hypothetical protein BT63DRAFT_403763 [Microthyrium microscopicum]|uniref:Large ribosomal subunit protein mL49 n=1 Tax=Microthyrium microscopicum TaxID=703497 RepID=A0A6A6U556_9PEZI|nr:hypothetical protein BT63DRAFT_403763 [Microthyrium microscopicum]
MESLRLIRLNRILTRARILDVNLRTSLLNNSSFSRASAAQIRKIQTSHETSIPSEDISETIARKVSKAENRGSSPAKIVSEGDSSTSAETTPASDSPLASQPTTEQPLLPYHVSRSHRNGFPIYYDYKGNRTLHQTIVRKITGDAVALKNDLIEHLQIDKKLAHVKQPTNQVVIKGQYKTQITEFLQLKRF